VQRRSRTAHRAGAWCACWARTRPCSYDPTHKPAWGNFIVEDDDGVEVPAFTVDQIMKHFDLSCIDLLKVDTEGGEKEVFANGHFISHVGLVIVELHDDYRLNDFARDIANWGFQAIAPEDRSGSKMIMASPPGSAQV
jgi:hypothetical protein